MINGNNIYQAVKTVYMTQKVFSNRKSFNMLESLPNDKEKIKKCDSRNKKTKLSKEKKIC